MVHQANWEHLDISQQMFNQTKQRESPITLGGGLLRVCKIKYWISVTVALLQDNYPLKWNESLLSWLSSFWSIFEESKDCIYVQYMWFLMWACCCPWVMLIPWIYLDFSSLALLPVRWGSMMKPGWSSNRSTTPTWERVGNRRKSSLWVFVSAVRCLGWLSWCLRK